MAFNKKFVSREIKFYLPFMVGKSAKYPAKVAGSQKCCGISRNQNFFREKKSRFFIRKNDKKAIFLKKIALRAQKNAKKNAFWKKKRFFTKKKSKKNAFWKKRRFLRKEWWDIYSKGRGICPPCADIRENLPSSFL